MRTLVLFLFVMASQVSNAAWLYSMEEAQRMALSTNRFIVVDFWASWCGPCKKMDVDAWAAPQVKELMSTGFVSLKINIDDERALAEKYGVKAIPFVMIIDANGKVVSSFDGYRNASGVIKEIERFAVSTEPIANELINCKKEPGFESAAQLAQKYYEFALGADSSVKGSLMGVARDYLSDAKKRIEKSDSQAAEKREKLTMLEICGMAYANQIDKVEKRLSKLSPDKISESNRNYYYFLAYLVARKNNSGIEAVEAKLPELSGFDRFKEQADLILKS